MPIRSCYNLPVKVCELGEFGLIDLLAGAVAESGGRASGQRVVLGIGDDAAAWKGEAHLELATTDTLVEGVHFTQDIGWYELGWKSLAANLSDIAAMGGVARYALVSLALPDHTEVDQVVDMYRGMARLAQEFEVAIVGGDTVSSPVVVINIAVMGSAVASQAILRRSAARSGDLVAVTGYLGSAAGGLEVLRRGLHLDYETGFFLRQAHFLPRPRLAEGQALVGRGVRAAIDISDGLVADLGQIAKASQVGARLWVDKVPLHPLLKQAFKEEALGLALSGGEDYELLFTAPEPVIAEVEGALSCPVTVVGDIIEGKAGQVELLDARGRSFPWQGRGWEHFAPA